MTSSYSTDLKLELMVTGENAGTWGDKTNTNLNVIQQAIAGFEQVTLSSGNPEARMSLTSFLALHHRLRPRSRTAIASGRCRSLTSIQTHTHTHTFGGGGEVENVVVSCVRKVWKTKLLCVKFSLSTSMF